MKSKKIQLLIVLSIIIILGFGFGIKNMKKNDKIEENKEEDFNMSEGEFTQKENDGTIVNISEKIVEERTECGFTIKDIKLSESNGETKFEALVTNTLNYSQDFIGNIVLYDKNYKETIKIPIRIGNAEPGEISSIEASINIKCANAYDFKLEK